MPLEHCPSNRQAKTAFPSIYLSDYKRKNLRGEGGKEADAKVEGKGGRKGASLEGF